eukprot:764337-Hanusia_phi.AAC.3
MGHLSSICDKPDVNLTKIKGDESRDSRRLNLLRGGAGTGQGDLAQEKFCSKPMRSRSERDIYCDIQSISFYLDLRPMVLASTFTTSLTCLRWAWRTIR